MSEHSIEFECGCKLVRERDDLCFKPCSGDEHGPLGSQRWFHMNARSAREGLFGSDMEPPVTGYLHFPCGCKVYRCAGPTWRLDSCVKTHLQPVYSDCDRADLTTRLIETRNTLFEHGERLLRCLERVGALEDRCAKIEDQMRAVNSVMDERGKSLGAMRQHLRMAGSPQ